jgi:aspartate aminotransferase
MAASAVAFHLLANADEEAIFSTPSWFLYEPMLRAADAVPKK